MRSKPSIRFGIGLLARVLRRSLKLCRLDLRPVGGIPDEANQLGNTIDIGSPRHFGTRNGEGTKDWSRERKHEECGHAQNDYEGERSPRFPTPPCIPRASSIAVVVNQSRHGCGLEISVSNLALGGKGAMSFSALEGAREIGGLACGSATARAVAEFAWRLRGVQ